jgi:hypothetical protein
MSESNLAEKITDTIVVKIANLIDETKIFEKIADIGTSIGIYIVALTLFPSIIGITNIAIHYSSNNKNNKLLHDNKAEISRSIDINRSICVRLIEMRISELENRLSFILENQQICLNEIKKMHIKNHNSLSRSTSISGFPCILDNEYQKLNYVLDEKESRGDDELLNECYDSLPLSNFKKNTSLTWLFTPLKI